MANKNAPPGKPDLLHQGYSRMRESGENVDMYQGRPRITSRSKTVNGGVYYPRSMEGEMEAIVVDWDKDEGLKAYIPVLEVELSAKLKQLQAQGHKPDIKTMIDLIARKIAWDFPYSQRMRDRKYCNAKYKPGEKNHLGRMMDNQDMICRHMGLLAAAVLEHMKLNGKIKKNRDIRYVADHQEDLIEGEHSGHAYVFVADREATPNEYYIVDPAGGYAVSFRDMLKKKERARSTGTYRYLFSGMRVLLQEPDPRDKPFLVGMCKNAKKDANIEGVLNDLAKTFTKNADVAAQRYLTQIQALAA